ncbi:MAG: hypothetical protein ACPL7D_06240, partial [Candidatus Sumerlaeaceae bacterium]
MRVRGQPVGLWVVVSVIAVTALASWLFYLGGNADGLDLPDTTVHRIGRGSSRLRGWLSEIISGKRTKKSDATS